MKNNYKLFSVLLLVFLSLNVFSQADTSICRDFSDTASGGMFAFICDGGCDGTNYSQEIVNGELKLGATKVSWNFAQWWIKPFDIQAYPHFSIDMRSLGSSSVSVRIKDGDGNQVNKTINTTSSMQTFDFDLTSDASTWTTTLNEIQFDFPTDTFFIDNVKLGKVAVGTFGSDASLSDLTVGTGSLSPAFNTDSLSYTVDLPAGDTMQPTITPTSTDANATIMIMNAENMTSDSAHLRTATVKVISEDAAHVNEYDILFNVSLGDDEIVISDGINLYPNPVNNQLYIGSVEQANNIVIVNLLGQEIMSMDVNDEANVTLNVGGLADGVYILKALNDATILKTTKFIKR